MPPIWNVLCFIVALSAIRVPVLKDAQRREQISPRYLERHFSDVCIVYAPVVGEVSARASDSLHYAGLCEYRVLKMASSCS